MTIPDDPLAPRRVAGYRVLRPLARDVDAEVLLGYRAEDGDDAAGQTVALKVSKVDPGSWSRAVGVLEALERARGAHVVEVLDLEADDDRLTMVFERLPRGSLAELLALRERLDPGEVVTVLAPIAAALHRMHAGGVAHGAVGARTIMFRDDGAPVLMGFGHASLFMPGAPEVVHEQQPGVIADRTAARSLASRLLILVTGARARAARELAEQLRTCPDAEVLELLRTGLFSMAAALPVRFRRDGETAVESLRVVPIRSDGGGDTDAADTDAAALGARRDRLSVLGRVFPEATAQRVLDAVDGSPVARMLRPVLRAAGDHWARWPSRRRRVVVAGLAAAVVFATALAVVPSPSQPSALAEPAGGRGVPRASPDAGSTTAPASADTALTADDPLAASIELVRLRDRCLRSLSLACLDTVEQSDSGALRDDRAVIGVVQRGGELPDPLVGDADALAPVLVERSGDSALVRLAVAASASGSPSGPQRAPASLLLVKGEAGWRIRDLIAAPSGTG